MDWRKLERELVNILKSEGVDLRDEAGDSVVVRGDLIVFSITDLAKQLIDRITIVDPKKLERLLLDKNSEIEYLRRSS